MRYWAGSILVVGLFLGAVVLFNVELVALLDVGTCASGNTPYEIARPCPEGTETDALLLVASIFAPFIAVGIPGPGRPARGSLERVRLAAARVGHLLRRDGDRGPRPLVHLRRRGTRRRARRNHLQRLREAGALTPAEFEAQKARVLKGG